jgi:putative ABC transport system ATP-binding protein
MTSSEQTDGHALIKLHAVKKIYGTGQAAMEALRGIDIQIDEGDFVAVMGPSGSGKSTCLNILGCLDTPSSGNYFFKDVAVEELNRNQRAQLRRHYLGFVFQGFNLLSRTSALENVELPLIYRGVHIKERQRLADQALEAVGLKEWRTHAPNELSGGQQQRVAIARAIVTKPMVLMADEPTGNLDTVRSHEIMDLLVELNHRQGITIVMVTHEPDMAAYAKRIIHFLDGRIESDKQNGRENECFGIH